MPVKKSPAKYRVGIAVRLVCLALASASLAGCIVVPARPYYHPRYYYY